MKFADLQPKLSSATLEAIQSFGFVSATPVQASTIPLFMQHKDVCVDAMTGSGKTLAFGIPIFEMLSKVSPPLGLHDIGALVVSPTRELAVQIFEVLSKLASFHSGLTCMLLVGGTSVKDDTDNFVKNGGHVLIATPGRVLDVRSRLESTMSFRRLEILVLDEADKLLDMGFKDSINQILSALPKQRRTGLFSATQTKEVKELVRAGLRNPVIVAVKVQHKAPSSSATSKTAGAEAPTPAGDAQNSNAGSISAQITPTSLRNWYLVREYDDRIHDLVQFLRSHEDKKVIVFVATCACVDYYSTVFARITQSFPGVLPKSLEVVGFHGKMKPAKRTAAYRKFKALPSGGVMFSTDVAARGIDIPDVDWIVQLTAPKDPSFFVHRVGRTARAGRCGQALIFLSQEESSYLPLLRGRGVPLHNADDPKEPGASQVLQTHPIHCGLKEEDYGSVRVAYRASFAVLHIMKTLAKADRDLLEMSSAAFVAFLRAYTEHLCSYIFRLADLDIGAVARSYALLRLPKMAETRGVKGKPIVFDTDPTNTSTIAYRNADKEKHRQKKLAEALAAAAAEEEEEEEGGGEVSDIDSDDGQQHGGSDDDHDGSDGESDSDVGSGNSSGDDSSAAAAVAPASRKAKVGVSSSAASVRTSRTTRTGQVKAAWIPEAQYKELLAEKEKNKARLVTTADGALVAEKRQRKRKQSYVQKFKAEWDDIADEEALYRKFKKGKISKAEYEAKLTSVADREDEDDDEGDEDDEPLSRKKAKRAGKAAGHAGKKIDYRNQKKRKGGW